MPVLAAVAAVESFSPRFIFPQTQQLKLVLVVLAQHQVNKLELTATILVSALLLLSVVGLAEDSKRLVCVAQLAAVVVGMNLEAHLLVDSL